MAKMKRPLTDAEREQRRAQQRELVAASVEQLRTSDGWQGYLKARRTFSDYSWRNVLLILQQRPTASRVAGFRAWLDLGYCVQKRPADVPEGQWAIRIWARCEPSRKRLQAWRDAGADPDDRPRPIYKLVSVFAQDQVAELPPPATPTPLEPPHPAAIEGDSHVDLLAELAGLAREIGYAFEIARTGQADGLCDRKARRILLDGNLSPNGQLLTGIHELAHALIGDDELAPKLTRAEEELIVESVAWCCCQTVDLTTDANSIPYLASWAQNASLDVLQRDAELCDRLARRIDDALLSALPEPDAEPEPPEVHDADVEPRDPALAA